MGRDVHVWTVNNTEEMSRYSAMGVTSIITDRPDVLSQLLLREAEMSIFQLGVLSILMTKHSAPQYSLCKALSERLFGVQSSAELLSDRPDALFVS
jgi:hypothetical protein